MAKAGPPPEPARPSRSGNPAVRSGQQAPRPARPKVYRPAAVQLPAAQEVLPPDGAPYPLMLRGPGFSVGRSLLGVLAGISLFVLLSQVVSQLVVAIGWALTAPDQLYADYFRSAVAFERPIGMLGANLGIISLIGISVAMLTVMHKVRPRWLLSVRPGVRWRYLLVCLVLALVTLTGVLLVSLLGADRTPISMQPGFLGFLVVILLTSPLQAAAEELFFRGYLLQALGSLVAQPWFGVLASSVVFALLHGTQNLPLFVDRLAFGLLAAILVWRTGGLEAGVAAHVLNNLLAYLLAGFTTGIPALKAVREITWEHAALNVGGFAVFAVLAYAAFRALRLSSTVDLRPALPAPSSR